MAAWDPLALNAFVFYDTEYTSWEGAMQRNWSGPDEHRELVQLVRHNHQLHPLMKSDHPCQTLVAMLRLWWPRV